MGLISVGKKKKEPKNNPILKLTLLNPPSRNLHIPQGFWHVTSLSSSHLQHVYDISRSSLLQMYWDSCFSLFLMPVSPHLLLGNYFCPIPFCFLLIELLVQSMSHLTPQLLLPCPGCCQLAPILSHQPCIRLYPRTDRWRKRGQEQFQHCPICLPRRSEAARGSPRWSLLVKGQVLAHKRMTPFPAI